MTIQSSFVAQTAYFVALTCASFCTALADEASRPTPDWSFAKLEQRSTAIVIVEVLSTRDANESDAITPLKGLEKNVAGVVTRFRILSTLKGTLDTKEINVKHFREVPVNGGYMGNGPCFVDFAPYIPKSRMRAMDLHLYFTYERMMQTISNSQLAMSIPILSKTVETNSITMAR